MRRILVAIVLAVAVPAAGCTDATTPTDPSAATDDVPTAPAVPDVDVEEAAAGAAPPHDVLVDGGWPEVAAFVAESADQGRGTVVNLFASWCAPCERELPLLLDVSATTPGVRWLGVASEDRRRDAEPFVERLDVTWPSVLDPSATTHIAIEGIAMPTTAFFDATGELRSIVIGELDEERLAAELALITP